MQGEDLLQSHFRAVPLSNMFKFEGIANRDSLPYAETYNIGAVSALDTVLRGTLRQVLGASVSRQAISSVIHRYPGFCTLLRLFQRIGLLEDEQPIVLRNWASFSPRALSSKFAIPLSDDDAASLRSALGDILDITGDALSQLIDVLDWLGITPIQHGAYTPQRHNTLPMLPPSTPLPPIDLLTMVLSHQLRYEPGERDMVVLMHEITVGPPSAHGKPVEEETHTSTLIAYGTPSSSAMSRTVGLPVALAALAVLDGEVHARGVQGPTMESVYGPVLRGLEASGLGMKEKVVLGGGSRRGLRDGLWASMGRGGVVGSLEQEA
jgi:alpha-aminoadipic semialdehyde synthase